MPIIIRICELCKKEFSIKQSDVNRGRGRFCTKSCSQSGINNPSYKHGHGTRKQSKEYKTWAGVKSRVLHGNKLNRQYYKDKGILMCDRWLNSFENFLEDMGEAPSSEHQIDRIDPNGHYEPTNCRWVTRKEQMNNTTFNKLITYDGLTLTQSQWADKLEFPNSNIILKRLKRGWSTEKTLTTPLGQEKGDRYIEFRGQRKPMREWAKITGFSRELISWRIDKANWGVEKALTTPKKY